MNVSDWILIAIIGVVGIAILSFAMREGSFVRLRIGKWFEIDGKRVDKIEGGATASNVKSRNLAVLDESGKGAHVKDVEASGDVTVRNRGSEKK